MKIIDVMTVATWNCQGLATKKLELKNILKECKANIIIMTDAKKKLKDTIGVLDCLMIYSGVSKRIKAC